jgi:hypothetical protein
MRMKSSVGFAESRDSAHQLGRSDQRERHNLDNTPCPRSTSLLCSLRVFYRLDRGQESYDDCGSVKFALTSTTIGTFDHRHLSVGIEPCEFEPSGDQKIELCSGRRFLLSVQC